MEIFNPDIQIQKHLKTRICQSKGEALLWDLHTLEVHSLNPGVRRIFSEKPTAHCYYVVSFMIFYLHSLQIIPLLQIANRLLDCSILNNKEHNLPQPGPKKKDHYNFQNVFMGVWMGVEGDGLNPVTRPVFHMFHR